MRTINLQKYPIIPAKHVIQDVEGIVLRYGYKEPNQTIDIDSVYYQRCYEIPNEGLIYLDATDRPVPEGYASRISFLGFNESESRILRELETDLDILSKDYLIAINVFIGTNRKSQPWESVDLSQKTRDQQKWRDSMTLAYMLKQGR